MNEEMAKTLKKIKDLQHYHEQLTTQMALGAQVVYARKSMLFRMKKDFKEMEHKDNSAEKVLESESKEYLKKHNEHNEKMLKQMKLSESSVDMARMLSVLGIRAMRNSVKMQDEQRRLKKVK